MIKSGQNWEKGMKLGRLQNFVLEEKEKNSLDDKEKV